MGASLCKVVKELANLRYDFSLTLITRNSQQTKQTVTVWCREHGLQNARIREGTEGSGWTSYQVFSSYLDKQNCVTLNSNDTRRAFEELLQALRRVDDKIRVRSNWQNLEKYIALEQEATMWRNKLRQIEAELDKEELNMSCDCIVHETQNFDADDDVMNLGTHREIIRHFNHA